MKTKKSLLMLSFSVAEFILLCLILWGPSKLTAVFEFSSILFAFAFSLLFVSKNQNVWLTQIALLFTVIADFCLEIVSPMKQGIAMTSFAIVQLFHFARLFSNIKTKKWKIFNIIVRTIFVIAVEIVVYFILKEKFDYLSAISMFYITNLILNIFVAFCQFKKSPMFALGLLLFLGCDIIIGLQSAIGVYIDVPVESFLYSLAFAPFNIAWLCYLPSQTLVSLSAIKEANRPFWTKQKI